MKNAGKTYATTQKQRRNIYFDGGEYKTALDALSYVNKLLYYTPYYVVVEEETVYENQTEEIIENVQINWTYSGIDEEELTESEVVLLTALLGMGLTGIFAIIIIILGVLLVVWFMFFRKKKI